MTLVSSNVDRFDSYVFFRVRETEKHTAIQLRESPLHHAIELIPCSRGPHKSDGGVEMLGQCGNADLFSEPLVVLMLAPAALTLGVSTFQLFQYAGS